MSILELKGSPSYGSVAVLKGIDIEVRSGEVLALVGENGAGKLSNLEIGSPLSIDVAHKIRAAVPGNVGLALLR